MNEFEVAVVNEPSVFEPLKIYCISVLVVADMHSPSLLTWYVYDGKVKMYRQKYYLPSNLSTCRVIRYSGMK